MKKYILGAVLSLGIIISPVFAQALDGDYDMDGQSSCVNLQNNLRYRSNDSQTGGEVSLLQDFLQSAGHLNSEPTGFFGKMTRSAVVSYQKDIGLDATGFVGPLTRGKIKSATCENISNSSVDMRIDGSDGPVNLADNQAITVTLTTKNVSSCTISGIRSISSRSPMATNVPMSGDVNKYTLYAYVPVNGEETKISVQCNETGGNIVSDSVSINAKVTTEPLIQVISPNGGESIDVTKQLSVKVRIVGLRTLSLALYENLYGSDRLYGYLMKDVSTSGRPNDFEWVHVNGIVSISFPEFKNGSPPVYKIHATGQSVDGTKNVEDTSDATFRFIAPTQTAVPTITFTAMPDTINSGETSVLSWSATNATSCTGGGESINVNATSGSVRVNPVATKTYEVTCTGPGGSTVKGVEVAVKQLTPPTVNVSATPSFISEGGSITLEWSSGNAASCTASGSWDGVVATYGTRIISNVQRNSDSKYNYILTCSGPGGSDTGSISVTMNATAKSRNAIRSGHIKKLAMQLRGRPSSGGKYVCVSASCSKEWSVYGTDGNIDGLIKAGMEKPSDPADSTRKFEGYLYFDQNAWGGVQGFPPWYYLDWTAEPVDNVAEACLPGQAVGVHETYIECLMKVDSAPISSSQIGSNSNLASAFSGLESATSQRGAAAVSAAFAYTFTQDLYRGQIGTEVSALQRALVQEGLFSVSISGEFFDHTRDAVVAFQEKYGIKPTGYVGPATRAKLNELYGK